MNRPTISILLALPLALSAGPADTLTLKDCLTLSTGNLPFRALTQASLEVDRHQERLAGMTWYPSMSFNATASYQSEVTTIPLEIPGIDIPAPSQDQYAVYLEIRQVLYDAGLSKATLEIALLSERIHRNEAEISQRAIRETAAELFYATRLIRSQRKVLALTGEVLREHYRAAEALHTQGAIPRKGLLEMEAAILAWEQQLAGLASAENQGLVALSILTGIDLDTSTVLLSGDLPLPDRQATLTPEMKAFELRMMQADASARLIGRKLLPRASVFGRAGIGQPGLNMLSDEFSEYYIVGAGLIWSPWDWGQSRAEKDIAGLRKDELHANYEIYRNNLNIQQEKLREEMTKYPGLISRADTLIAVREEIRKASAAAMAEGSVTTGEYLIDHNASLKAMLERSRFSIESEKVLVQYLLLTGQF